MSIKKVLYINTAFIILLLTVAGVFVIWEMTREVAPQNLKEKPRYVEQTWPEEDLLADKEYSRRVEKNPDVKRIVSRV